MGLEFYDIDSCVCNAKSKESQEAGSNGTESLRDIQRRKQAIAMYEKNIPLEKICAVLYSGRLPDTTLVGDLCIGEKQTRAAYDRWRKRVTVWLLDYENAKGSLMNTLEEAKATKSKAKRTK